MSTSTPADGHTRPFDRLRSNVSPLPPIDEQNERIGNSQQRSYGRKDASGGIKPVDKRSLDYVLRSGLAGGLAGCAVSTSPTLRAGEPWEKKGVQER